MLYQRLTPDFIFSDDRGTLTQLVHTGYTQINVVTSKAGILRGSHYHKQSTEAFYVISGTVDVTLSREGKEEKATFQSGDFFQIEPYIVHSMFYPEDAILVALYDMPVELKNGEKDIFTAESDKNG